MIKEIPLQREILQKVFNGGLKATELIQYVIDNTEGEISIPVNKACLADIIFNGFKAVTGSIDTFKEKLILELEEVK